MVKNKIEEIENNDNTELNLTDVDEEIDDYIVKFSEPYNFNGKDYSEIDLSNIKELTAKSMIKAQQISKANFTTLPEANLKYIFALAHFATKLPLEFFENLNLKDATRVRMKVSNFLLLTD